MKKRLVVVIGFILVFLIGFFLLVISRVQTPSKTRPNSPFFPTPTPISLTSVPNQSIALKIVSTNPPDNDVNDPPDQKITITFNRSFSPNEITITMTPNLTYTSVVANKNLIITPTTTLAANTTYSYTITYVSTGTSQTRIFTTLVPGIRDTHNSTDKEKDDLYRTSYPDAFLVNHMPHETNDFSLKYATYINDPTPHYYFVILLTGTDKVQSKNDFLSWLRSLGLGDIQIQTLDLHYVNY